MAVGRKLSTTSPAPFPPAYPGRSHPRTDHRHNSDDLEARLIAAVAAKNGTFNPRTLGCTAGTPVNFMDGFFYSGYQGSIVSSSAATT